MLSTMQDHPLTITDLFSYGRTVHAGSTVVTFESEGTRRATFGEIAERADRLAGALARLGIRAGDRVATYSWNVQEHLETYFAVPAMGAESLACMMSRPRCASSWVKIASAARRRARRSAVTSPRQRTANPGPGKGCRHTSS